MNKNPHLEGRLSENFNGVGTVSPEMVQVRAAELAVINGRSAEETNKSDWEQARRELTGGSEMTSEEIILDNAPESQRWNPTPGTPGHQMPENSNEDEDEEGRTPAERLVQQGVEDAEHDQMLQAAKAKKEEDFG